MEMLPPPALKLADVSVMPFSVPIPFPVAVPEPFSAVPPPKLIFPPLLVMPEPVLKTITPPFSPSESLLSSTLSLPVVAVMVLWDATVILLLAKRLKVASVPAVLVIKSLTAMVLPLSTDRLPPVLPMAPMLMALMATLPVALASLRPTKMVPAVIRANSADEMPSLSVPLVTSADVPPTSSKVPAVRFCKVTMPLPAFTFSVVSPE